MHDWDDLRYFIAASRLGSLSAAAQHLGVDAATVGRRIARLETALRSTLFVRSTAGLVLTSSGGRLLDAAMDAEIAMEAVSRIGERDIIGGTVRLSVSEGFGTAIVAPALASFVRERPHINVELAAQTGFLSPSTREVDIAVTLSAPSAARLVVAPLTEYELGLYASAQYLEETSMPRALEDLSSHTIVGYIDDLIYAPELRYLDEIRPGLQAKISSSSIRAQREIILAGGGVGVLPCFMSSGLERIFSRRVRLKRRFWLSTHRDVADLARIRVTVRWLKSLVKKRTPILLPTRT